MALEYKPTGNINLNIILSLLNFFRQWWKWNCL